MRTQMLTPALLALATVFPASGAETMVANVDEFHQSVKAARPGDVIILANGTWRDVELVADATGTPDSPIIIRAQEPGGVTISGDSRLRISGRHIVVSGLRFHKAWHKTALIEFRKDSKKLASDCRLTDCEIIDCDPPNAKDELKYLSIYGRHNFVDHCRLQGKTSRGATLVVWLYEGGGQHSIRRNHFGPRPLLGQNGGETIRLGDSETAHLVGNTAVEGNLFEECNGETEAVSNKSCENVYRGNVFLRCSGTLTLRHGHRCLVERNLFLGEKARGSGGVRIIGSDHTVVNNYFEALEGDDYRSALCIMNGIPDSPANGYQPVERAIVAHNAFVECKRTIVIGADNDEKTQVPPNHCLFANNVIVSRRGPMIDLWPEATNIRWLGNRCFGLGELGIEEQPGVMRLDAAPLKRGQLRWTLYDGSPLVDAGDVHSVLPKSDLAGRVRDAAPDVGCDEWPIIDGDVAARQVKVGPAWSPTDLLPLSKQSP